MFEYIKKLIAVGLLISSLFIYTSADDVLTVLRNVQAEIYLTLQPDEIKTLYTIDVQMVIAQMYDTDDSSICTCYVHVKEFDISFKNLQSGSESTTASCGLLSELSTSMKKPYTVHYKDNIVQYYKLYNNETFVSEYLKILLLTIYNPNVDAIAKVAATSDQFSEEDTIHDSESCKVKYQLAKKIPVPGGTVFKTKSSIDMNNCNYTNTVNLTLDASCSDISEKPINWKFQQAVNGLQQPTFFIFDDTKIAEQNTYKPWKEIEGMLSTNLTVTTEIISVKFSPVDIEMYEEASKQVLSIPPREVDYDLVAQHDKGGLTKLYSALTCSNTNYRNIDLGLIKLAIQCESQ